MKERSLFVAFFKRATEKIALSLFLKREHKHRIFTKSSEFLLNLIFKKSDYIAIALEKERKSKQKKEQFPLLCALFGVNRSLPLFWKRAKKRIAPCRSFWKEQKSEERKSNCPTQAPQYEVRSYPAVIKMGGNFGQKGIFIIGKLRPHLITGFKRTRKKFNF